MTTWMPIYWGDYLKKTGHLSTEEHGAYLLLICHLWTTAKPILDDDRRLAAVTKSSVKKWKIMRPILSEFFEILEGHWHHIRVNEEIARSLEIKGKRALAGSYGGKKRQANAIANAKAFAQAKGVAKSNQSQSQSHKEDSSKELSLGDCPRNLPKNPLEGFERFYLAYPIHKGRGQAERAYQAAIKSGVDHEAIIAGATAYAVQCQRNGTEKRFIKHPSTWLNGKCWLDEHSSDSENCGGTGRANSGAGARRGSVLEAAAAAMGDGSGEFGLFADIGRGGPGYAQGDAGGGYRGATLDLPAIGAQGDYQGPDADKAYDQERQFDTGRDFNADGDLRR